MKQKKTRSKSIYAGKRLDERILAECLKTMEYDVYTSSVAAFCYISSF